MTAAREDQRYKCNRCAALLYQSQLTGGKRCTCGGRFYPFEQKNKRAEPRAGRPGSEDAQRPATFESPRSSGAVPEGHEGARARAPRWIDVPAADVKPGDTILDPPTGCMLVVAYLDSAMRSLAKPEALLFIGYERKGGMPLGYFAAPTEVLRVKGPQ